MTNAKPRKQTPAVLCNLPEEVVSHIFRFLPICDLKASALVCHIWAKASEDPLLWKDTTIVLYTKSEAFPNVLIDSLQHRHIQHVRFMHTATPLQIIQVCKRLAGNLQSLILQGCRCVNDVLLGIILKSCTHLRKLDLSRCRQLDVGKRSTWLHKNQHSLREVTDIELSCCKDLSDWMVGMIPVTFPNIALLGISGCKEIRLSTWQSLGGNLTSLTSLDISRSDISDDVLLKFAQVPSMSLKVINLSACKQLTDNGVVSLVKYQKRLQSLKLSCLDVTNTSIIAIGKYLSDLRVLDLNSCRQVTDGALLSCKRLVNTLTSLNLYSCYLLSSKEMEKFFCSSKSAATVLPLQNLVLNGCTLVTDSFLKRCVQVLTNLQELDISSCLYVGDDGIRVITSSLINLQVLKISWCANVTDEGLLGTSQTSNQSCADPVSSSRKSLGSNKEWEHNSEGDHETVEQEPGAAGVANLSKLQVLDLSHCTCVTDNGLASVYGLRNLLSLNINMCIEITDFTLQQISCHLRSLKHLSINGCNLVTDTGLVAIAQKLSRLVSLDVSKCDNITDLGVLHLAKHGKCLTHIDLSMCSQVTSHAIDELETNIPGLVSLQLRYSGAQGSAYQSVY